MGAIQGVAVDSTMFDYQGWTFNANGRTRVAGGTGWRRRRHHQPLPVDLGRAQSGLCIKVASQEEAAKRLETEVEKLLGPEW